MKTVFIFVGALLLSVAPAYAGHWHGHGWGYGIGGNIIGGVIGGVIGGWFSRPAPAPVIVQQAPAPMMELRPWTAPWYDWCRERYRSFNPQTGYYLSYDGEQRFCGG